MAKPNIRQLPPLAFIAAIICIVVIVVVVLVALQKRVPADGVVDYQTCQQAGGSIGESYPEQCFIDGKSFVNDQAQSTDDPASYVGLTEAEAAARADEADKAHRVVERDGRVLPVTMDLVLGRLNFYVKEGSVYHVEVEGGGGAVQ